MTHIGFSRFTTSKGEIILYKGSPNLSLLESLASGPGDIWHSSFEGGLKNAFPEIGYQTATYFWFLNDFDGLDECISWRIDPDNFAIRLSAWDQLKGYDPVIQNPLLQAFDLGLYAIRYGGAVPLYEKGLFSYDTKSPRKISREDRYGYYRRNFKARHTWYMLYRKGLWNFPEWNALFKARKKYPFKERKEFFRAKELGEISGLPSVSYIIPTMNRQDYTLQLLADLELQTYPPKQVVVVDATSPETRDESLYDQANYSFELKVKWQETKGSCRARNEAIDVCTGDYIIFGDDDIRIPSDFIKNHLRFLQTYNVDACAGMDIQAKHHTDGLNELSAKLEKLGETRYMSGVPTYFSNSNGCVRRDKVLEIGGNDINFDGGYGEDADFEFSLLKAGTLVLFNPYSANLHLKPPAGGYRVWGSQAKVTGKKRKIQPWELEHPVRWIRPVPSPTVMYLYYKHFGRDAINELRHRYFFRFLLRGSASELPKRIFSLPYRILQFNKSVQYAARLDALGKRSS